MAVWTPALLALLCATAAAQPPAEGDPPVLRQTIVVTGTFQPLPLEEADRTVLSLPARGNALLSSSLADSLRLNAAVDLRSRAPNLLQGDLSLRGAGFAQTLVLVNGLRVNDAQTGHHNLDLPFPLEAVESVEVLLGAGSTLYGSDAVGGVLHVITGPPEAGTVRLRAALGNFGVNQESATLAGVRGRLSGQLFAARDFSTGFQPNRDYRNLSAGSSARWRSTGIDVAYGDKPFGAQGFYGAYPSWERTRTWFAGIRQSIGDRTEAAIGWRQHGDLFYLYRDSPERYQNRHRTESWQAALRRRDWLGRGFTLAYGAEGYGDSIRSTNLGAHDRARGSGYLNLDARSLGRFSLTAGVRTESFRGAFDQVSPAVALGYWASSKIKLRASASRAFRLPTYTDLYYRDPANVGDPSLRPERSWNVEGGADWRPAAAWRLQATVFQRRDRDLIDYTRPVGSVVWHAGNTGRLVFTGVETGAAWRHGPHLLEWSYAALHGSAAPPPGVESKYVFRYPAHSGVFGWTANLPLGLVARTRFGAMERYGSGVYAVWDLYAARGRGRLRPFAQFTNLTDARYQEIPGVAMPGRAVVGGLELVLR
jgi:iron complex outermembrane receptor protein